MCHDGLEGWNRIDDIESLSIDGLDIGETEEVELCEHVLKQLKREQIQRSKIRLSLSEYMIIDLLVGRKIVLNITRYAARIVLPFFRNFARQILIHYVAGSRNGMFTL